MSEPRPELERTARLAGTLGEGGLDALLVTNPVNVRYLTGFSGSSGIALVRATPTGGDAGLTFFTDFRYETQSAEQLPGAFERRIVTGDLLDAAADAVRDEHAGRLGFEETGLTFSRHAHLTELLAPAGTQAIPCANAVENLRSVKSPEEVARIRAAAELADEALSNVLEGGLVGRSERDVAIELELQMRRLGAEAPSFPSIVAAGAHGALPHAKPRGEEIPPEVLVTIDWGALHDGYCSDCTRTFATGEHLADEAREIYGVALRALTAARDAARAGPSGRALDAVAREVIEEAGYGDAFGHGLGHGVGMEIHEGPRLSRTAGEHPLLAGNIVTLEPGIYIPGSCGVRIEDLALVTESGAEILTTLGRELTVVS
jgi:Xaa-Pro aminopeptidase